MWRAIEKLFPLKAMAALLGGVVFECQERQGLTSGSIFQWRVKRAGSGVDRRLYLGLKVLADGSVRLGGAGPPTCYINFVLETARRIRDDLDECIAALEAEERQKAIEATSPEGTETAPAADGEDPA